MMQRFQSNTTAQTDIPNMYDQILQWLEQEYNQPQPRCTFSFEEVDGQSFGTKVHKLKINNKNTGDDLVKKILAIPFSIPSKTTGNTKNVQVNEVSSWAIYFEVDELEKFTKGIASLSPDPKAKPKPSLNSTPFVDFGFKKKDEVKGDNTCAAAPAQC